MSDMNLAQKRILLQHYAESSPHHAFKLKGPSQQFFEGYILEVQQEHILFSWAPSPFDASDDLWMQEHEIPISDIDISSIIN